MMANTGSLSKLQAIMEAYEAHAANVRDILIGPPPETNQPEPPPISPPLDIDENAPADVQRCQILARIVYLISYIQCILFSPDPVQCEQDAYDDYVAAHNDCESSE